MLLHSKILVGSALAVLTFTFAGCSNQTATTTSTAASATTAASAMSAKAAVSLSGSFAGLNGKSVTGKVSITGDNLVLSGFSSDEGPDLHVYLTKGADEAAVTAGKQISLVSYNQASQTFSLKGVDASGYTNVVIHCDKAKAVFGAAALS